VPEVEQADRKHRKKLPSERPDRQRSGISGQNVARNGDHMDERPVTRYAKAPDGVSIAYQVTGNGPIDLVFCSGVAFPIDLLWEDTGFLRFAKRLGSFSRTVWSEVRGMGASSGNLLDTYVDDVFDVFDTDLAAVLDAVGCEEVVLVAASHGGPLVISFALRHPKLVSTLVLIDTFAHYVREDDYPNGFPSNTWSQSAVTVTEQWGTAGSVEALAPSKSGNQAFRSWMARCERLGIRPDEVASTLQAASKRDVRALLPTLTVPTLILHRNGDRFIRVEAGRYLAENIPGAKYVELPGDDHWFFVGDTDALLDDVEDFLTGSHQAPEGDVITTTILFTDIVSSTEQSARMGHRKWNALIHDHNAMVRGTLRRHRGDEVKTMGDGFLATFDATTRAVRAAADIVNQARMMDLEVRAGVHTGEVEVQPNDVVGLAVTIARRVCDLAGPGQVLVSEAVKPQLVGSGFTLSDEGTHVLKGVPDEWRLFAVGG